MLRRTVVFMGDVVFLGAPHHDVGAHCRSPRDGVFETFWFRLQGSPASTWIKRRARSRLKLALLLVSRTVFRTVSSKDWLAPRTLPRSAPAVMSPSSAALERCPCRSDYIWNPPEGQFLGLGLSRLFAMRLTMTVLCKVSDTLPFWESLLVRVALQRGYLRRLAQSVLHSEHGERRRHLPWRAQPSPRPSTKCRSRHVR